MLFSVFRLTLSTHYPSALLTVYELIIPPSITPDLTITTPTTTMQCPIRVTTAIHVIHPSTILHHQQLVNKLHLPSPPCCSCRLPGIQLFSTIITGMKRYTAEDGRMGPTYVVIITVLSAPEHRDSAFKILHETVDLGEG